MPGITILVVDDDASLRETLARFLETEGYAVLMASSGREALVRLDDVRPDILLLDLVMPESTGTSCSRRYTTRGRMRCRCSSSAPIGPMRRCSPPSNPSDATSSPNPSIWTSCTSACSAPAPGAPSRSRPNGPCAGLCSGQPAGLPG